MQKTSAEGNAILATLWKMAATGVVTHMLLFLGVAVFSGEQPFDKLVGDVRVGPVSPKGPYDVGFLTWGGDIAGFVANGGSLKTQKGSIYDKLGVSFNFVNGDDFPTQVKNYLSGKTPFIRAEVGMLGMASEVLNTTPGTKPRFLLQLTYSKGDHVISRETIKTLDDLRKIRSSGRKIRWCAQQGGPHVTLINSVIQTAGLTWSDIEPVWVPDIIGPKGPAVKFRSDKTIDLVCVITAPDGMLALTGGLDLTGSGGEGTEKGCHVVASTSQYDRVIADVIAVREDFYQAHRDVCERFVAGFLAGEQKLVTLKRAGGPAYKREVLQVAQNVFGKELLPELDTDAAGMVDDAVFVGLPGQIAFFEDAGNLQGFEGKQKESLDLAVNQGYASGRSGFLKPDFDYGLLATLAGVPYSVPSKQRVVKAESQDLSSYIGGEIDNKTLVTFTIFFDANQDKFSRDTYGADFRRGLVELSKGNVIMVVEGHSDTNEVLISLLKAGKEKGVITEEGVTGSKRYFLHGKPFDFNLNQELRESIQRGDFDTPTNSPRQVVIAAAGLSQIRANAVRDAIIGEAKTLTINLTPAQIQTIGLGVATPIVPVPRSAADKKQNRRVVFRIIKQAAESADDSEFIGK